MRNRLTRLIAIVLALSLFSVASLEAANKMWIGEICGFKIIEIESDTFQLTYSLQEDTTDGRFGSFSEFDIVKVYSENDGKGIKIIFDGVSAGVCENNRCDKGDLVILPVKNLVGSFSYPDFTKTLSEKEVFSAEITIKSDLKLSFVRVPVDKSDPSKVDISIKITLAREESKTVSGDNNGNVTTIELTPDDFADPFPVNTVDVAGELKKQLDALYSVKEDSFVTFFYPMKHMKPSSAKTLFTSKLSPWGWMQTNDDHSVLIITDRVNYVRSIVEAIIVVDRPVPQAVITARVMEITLTDEDQRGIIYNFKRGNPDAMDITLGNQINEELFLTQGISGAISHYSGANLKEFLVTLDLAVNEGKANILACPRTLTMNNKTAKFQVGETYYYFAPTTISRTSKDYDRAADESTSSDYVEDYYSNAVSLKSISTGVSLSVTPTINNSKQIINSITLSYDEVIGFSGTYELPIIASRDLTSTVRIKDGQTIVIGGLFREKDISLVKKTPGLGDIPLIKHLFRSTQKMKVKTELVFILTVELVK